MNFKERIASYQRKDTSIIVSQDNKLRSDFAGKTLGQMLLALGIEDEPEFIHWGDDNIPGFRAVSKDGIKYFFNCSGALSDIMEDKGFAGDILSLEGRKYEIVRPVLERVVENGVPTRKPKQENGVNVMETVESFNIGLPSNDRDNQIKARKPLGELELTPEQMAALLAE